MLEIHNISKTFMGPQGPVAAVRDLSLSARAGEFVAVRGPSGSGKTTLLLIAGGMLHPDVGRVVVAGQDVYRSTSEARARLRAATIGFVFQQFHLVPYLSVLDNVLVPTLARANPEAPKTARNLLVRLGLEARLRHRPAELSSGERQRCALARALVHQPRLVLADEPTANLDDANGAIVLDFLSEYAAAGGALLLVTHEASAAERAHRVLQLQPGGRAS